MERLINHILLDQLHLRILKLNSVIRANNSNWKVMYMYAAVVSVLSACAMSFINVMVSSTYLFFPVVITTLQTVMLLEVQVN